MHYVPGLEVAAGRDQLFCEGEDLGRVDLEPVLADVAVQTAIGAVLQEEVDIIDRLLTALELHDVGMAEFLPGTDFILDPMHEILQVIDDLADLLLVHELAGQHMRRVVLQPADVGGREGAPSQLLAHVHHVLARYRLLLACLHFRIALHFIII